jgi:hypothetical protein
MLQECVEGVQEAYKPAGSQIEPSHGAQVANDAVGAADEILLAQRRRASCARQDNIYKEVEIVSARVVGAVSPQVRTAREATRCIRDSW